MSDLGESARARLRKDEMHATAASGLLGIKTPWHTWPQLKARGLTRADARFIERFGPDRVLGDVETFRQIIALCESQTWESRGKPLARRILRLLAETEDDHDDGTDEWKP